MQRDDAERPFASWNDCDDRDREARDDAREDEQRHAVADAALRDELAHPHDERRARDERDDDDSSCVSHERDTGPA